MDKLKDKLKVQSPINSHGSKEDIKISFQIKILKVTGLAKSSYSPLFISWKRGSKKENTGEFKTIPRDGEAAVDHSIQLNATITKTPKGYLEKSILFTIKEEKIGKKPNVLGTISVNLAQYAESKTEKTHPFPIQDKTKVVCNLYLAIQSSWLKVNGKSMVKAEGNQKEILQELGKQKISHEGSDYFLQTEQDMSEPDQTDFGGDNHDSDNEDEDHVDFEDESNDKSNVSSSSLSRKSSSSSIGKNDTTTTTTTTSSGSGSANTSSSNLNQYISTTPTIKEEEEDEKSINVLPADLKIKKYKKQLKTLKSELEKSKSAYSNIQRDRDDKVEELKRMIDDMESIKDRSKTVGNGVISDYTNQIETLNNRINTVNKENGELKHQIQRERTQSSTDSNQITVLQNQLLTINSQLDTIRTENTTLNNQVRTLESQLRESSSNKPEDLQNALATVQNLHLELNQLRGQLSTVTEENRNQFIQLEQERLKSNSSESNVNRVEQEKLNLQQRLEHYERTIHLQLEDFEKEKLNISVELGELKSKLLNYQNMESELQDLKSSIEHQSSTISSPQHDDTELLEAKDLIIQLKDKLTAKESLFKETEDQLIEYQDKLAEKESIYIDTRNQLDQLKDQFEQLNSNHSQQVEQLNSNHSEQVEQLKKEIELVSNVEPIPLPVVDDTELLEAKDLVIQLKDKLTAKESLFKETEDQLIEYQDKLAEKESVYIDTRNQLDQLKDQFEQLQAKQSEQVPIPVVDETELSEAKDLVIQLKDKLIAKESLFKETEDQLEEKAIEISTLKDKLEQLEQQQSISVSEVEQSLESKIQQLENEKSELHLSLKQVELNSQDMTMTLEEKINQLTGELNSTLNVSRGNQQEDDDRIKELQDKFEKLKNKKSTYKVLVVNYKSEIDQLKSKQSSIQSESNDTIQDLESEISSTKQKLINQTEQSEIIADENTLLKQQLVNYKQDFESKQKVITDYQDMSSNLEKELDSIKLEKDQLELEIQNLRNNSNNNSDGNNGMKKNKGDNSDNDNSDDSDNDSVNSEIEEFKEKIQYQKEKIKALKEDLESKSDEWIDIKIKMEETINGKQEEIEKLKQQMLEQSSDSVAPLAAPIDNSSLHNEIDGLRTKIRQLESENQSIEYEKQQQVEQLQLELKNAITTASTGVSSIASSPRSSSNTATHHDNEIRKEMEENKNIEQSIYWSELDFDRNNVPYCGISVWQIIDGMGSLDKPSDVRMLSKIVTSLEKSFLRSGNDCKFISYWFSTVCYLLSKIQQSGYTNDSANPSKSGIEISVSSFVQSAPEIGGSFVRDLQKLNLDIYSKLLSVTEIKLEKVLIQSVYLPDSIILEAQKSPIKSTSPLGGTGNGSGRSMNSSVHSINNLLYILDGIILFLKEGRIFESVSNQFLNQIFYFMNSQITNHLLSNAKVCTTTQGLEVKMGVSRLKEWCSSTNYKTASQQLDSSLEASNLLVIDKNVFVDIDAIKSIFQKLNLHQIKHLLLSFTPDSLSPDTLPSILRKAIDSNWRQNNIDSLPLMIDQSKKFKI